MSVPTAHRVPHNGRNARRRTVETRPAVFIEGVELFQGLIA